MDPISLRRRLELAAKSDDPEERARKTQIGAVASALAAASLDIAEMISLGALGAPADGAARGFNIGAHQALAQSLRGAGVRAFISTEADETLAIDEWGSLAVEASPLSGSTDLDANMTAGTTFAITEAGGEDGTLPAGDPLAAGFVVYGCQTVLTLTLGDGVDIFTHDRRDRSWRLTAPGVRIPDFAHEYAVSAANDRRWNGAVRAFADDGFNGGNSDGERGFNSRWTGSLVADAFHILVRGGVLLDPAEARPGHERRSRLLCEARPIAYVIEQAGGRASTGCARILDLRAASPNARTPLILGSRPMVERVERLHSRPESLADVSPLFGKRGLFRA